MIAPTMTEPTTSYDEAIADVLSIIRKRIEFSSGERRRTLRTLEAEVSACVNGSRTGRGRRTREANLEAIVDDLASRVVASAVDDVRIAEERPDGPGNVISRVEMGFPETCKWLNYAARRGNEAAVALLVKISQRRSPGHASDRGIARAETPVNVLGSPDGL